MALSSSNFRWTVFLSFRGEDTRNNFTSHLYEALDREGIKTFKDDEELKRGELISEALQKAIKESRISIIIFSRNYANSRWCLEELILIMERWEKHGQKVFPVFLAGVDPLDVEQQKGSFGEAFGKHEESSDQETEERWRSALRAAAQLSKAGWSSADFRWNYDVVLSYKEEETGNNFASKLYASLERANIKIFKDNAEISKQGDQISEALVKGIKNSRCAIIIFSRNYASSTRCLEELSLIMECRKNLNQTVIPVFLMGVEGSDVRRQKGSFEEPFRRHQECFEPEVVERWRSDLKIAGDLCGLNLKDIPHGDEGKLIKKIVKDVIQYTKKGKKVTRSPSPEPVIEMPNQPIEKQKQPSTQRIMREIFDCIGNPEIGILGLYGMGGVGKTTLAKEVNNHFEKDFANGVRIPFEIVIMVTVSATLDVPSIQTSIGKRLGSRDNSVGELFKDLSKKKFLLILDDVWSEFNLEDVGIPHPFQHNKGSKIIVISWNQDTCTDMDADITIKVKPLSDKESWELFVKKAGVHVAADDIKCFAEKIVKRCKGLPLSIVTVAHAMRNRRGVGAWENAVKEMGQIRGMKEKVFVPLKFSFDSLENDMLRGLFLYCACFPEDYDIWQCRFRDEMLNYWVGEGLTNRLGSLKDAKNKGEDMIESLKIACMLEDGERKGTVRMHDVMRDFAHWITSSRSNGSAKFMIRIGKSVKEAPQAYEWVDATKISLMDTKIGELPELARETCQKLTTLLLKSNDLLTVIPPTNFFQHMDHLSVLDLFYTEKLEYLPNSLSYLVNLRVLRLAFCRSLRALPALGKLRRLEVLDLLWCEMLDQQIGSEFVGGASNLRYLDLEYSKVSIAVGVLSSLHKLEELNLFNAEKIKWRVSGSEEEKGDGSSSDDKGGQREGEDKEEERRSGSSSSDSIIDVEELSHLTHLTSLSISFEDIIISDWFKPLAKKITALELRHCSVVKQDALSESQNLKLLEIEGCLGVTCVPCIAALFNKLSFCKDLEEVFDGSAYNCYQDFYPSLQLEKLPKLKRLRGGLAQPNCFGQLWRIEILAYNNLKMIFTKEMTCLFNNLKLLKVGHCDRMEVIIEVEEEEVGKKLEGKNSNINGVVIISPFPRLQFLYLRFLPALHDVCRNHILKCPFVTHVEVTECPRLKKDPLHIQNEDGLLVIKDLRWLIGNKVMKDEEIQASLGEHYVRETISE